MSEHESTYVPKTGVEKWLDTRLPIIRFGADYMSLPTPRNLNYWWTFGGILALCLMTQIVTGIVLAMHYTPNVDLAFASVERIMRDVNGGDLIRYTHANGASMFFIAVYLHMLRGLYYGSYKAPREMIWIVGCLIFFLMIATAFLGYVLPWGQMSYWGAEVITNLIGAIPVIGEPVLIWLRGGPAIDNATLNRFFSLHYLLPFVIAALVAVHIWAFHTTGNNNPTGVEVRRGSKEEAERDTLPFWPYFVIKDLFALAVILTIFFAVVGFMPNFLGHPDNYIPANPLSTPAHIVPEWYFLPFYAILKAFTVDFGIPFTGIIIIPAKLMGVLAMFGSILLLFFLPWLDTSPVRSGHYRPLFRKFFWYGLIPSLLVLTYCGGKPPYTQWVVLSQLAAAYYFAHFLIILPIVSRIERPLPLPNSITEAVTGKPLPAAA